MKFKDLIEQNKLKLSVNPAGKFFTGIEPYNSSTDINLLLLDSVTKTKNGLMLSGSEVTVHIYGEESLLQEIEPRLQKLIGKGWNDIKEVNI